VSMAGGVEHARHAPAACLADDRRWCSCMPWSSGVSLEHCADDKRRCSCMPWSSGVSWEHCTHPWCLSLESEMCRSALMPRWGCLGCCRWCLVRFVPAKTEFAAAVALCALHAHVGHAQCVGHAVGLCFSCTTVLLLLVPTCWQRSSHCFRPCVWPFAQGTTQPRACCG
jgi:hypothetical protein